jgi:myo-inositol-1(or 4)-monophosphatase
MSDTLQFITDLARRTGKLLLDHFRVGGTDTRLKSDYTVVTEADLAADSLVTGAIREAYPQDLVLSEELHPSLPQGHTGAVWVVDPLDGTTNFSLGLPIWGVSIARVVNGMPETAATYFPLIGEIYTAHKGAGAYLNGERIRAQEPVKGKPTTYFACCGHTHRQYHVSVPYKPRILGSAAYNFCAVARGIAVLGFEATAKVWDLAAAWLLVPEAGGVIEAHHGRAAFPLTSGLDYTALAFPTLAAATAKMVAKGRDMIRLKESEGDWSKDN